MSQIETSDLRQVPDGPFTRREALAQGVSRWTLGHWHESGVIERLTRGLYQKVGSAPVDVDLVEAVERAPNATLCLVSALAQHGLVDEIPQAIDLAIRNGQRPPATKGPITWHRFDSDTFDVGRGVIPIEGTDLHVGLYSAERSIVDAFRLRQLVGHEVAAEALRAWLRRPGATPAGILAVADQLPRAQVPLRAALEYLA